MYLPLKFNPTKDRDEGSRVQFLNIVWMWYGECLHNINYSYILTIKLNQGVYDSSGYVLKKIL